MSRLNDLTWRPGSQDYQRLWVEANPWHETGAVPVEWSQTVERSLGRSLWRRVQTNDPRRFQLVLGPRRVGKTTGMYQTVQRLLQAGVDRRSLWWVRLDHPLLMHASLGDLVRSIITASGGPPKQPVYLFLDELTYADAWDRWLKTFYDENWPVQIVGTSSSTAALRDRMLESGVGRWEEQYLTPYLFTEYLDLIGQPIALSLGATFADTLAAVVAAPPPLGGLAAQRRRFLVTGGFPELLLNGDATGDEESRLLQSQRVLKSDAVERAIYKDIPQAFGVDRPQLLERVLYTLAGQVAGLVSPAKLCQSLGGLSLPTLEKYVAYLERSFLVFTVQNYSGSEANIQKRGRKLYFTDGAVRNAALQRGIGPLRDAAEMGLLMENMAAGHLHALGQQSQVRLFHWRDGDIEVDLIYDHPTHPVAFELASSGDHHRHGLRALRDRYPRFQNACYLVAPDVPPLSPAGAHDGIGQLPLDLLLLAAGRQAERALADRLAVG